MTSATGEAKLIGTARWNPRGESMLTVLEKVGLLNYLTPRELADLVGAHGALTFRAIERSDPGVRSTLRLDELLLLSGWQRHMLDASFPSYYRLPGSDPSVPDAIFFDLHPLIRICRTCAGKGQHLLLHQERALVRCPIHQEILTTACPACSSPLRRYAYPPDRSHSMRCGRCNWSAFSRGSDIDVSLQEARLDIMKDLDLWVAEVEQAVLGKHDRVRLLDPPRRFGDIARLDALIPGPHWLTCSLVRSARVRISQRPLELREQDIEAVVCPHGAGAPTVRGERTEESVQTHSDKVNNVAMGRVRKLRNTLPQLYNPNRCLSGVRQASFGYSIFLSERSSIAALGLRFWEDCLGSTLLTTKHRRSFATAARDTQEARLWMAWADGPKRLLRHRYQSPQMGLRIGREAVAVGESWFDHVLTTLFLALIGRASIVPGSPIQPGDLLDEAYDLGGTPVTAIIRDGSEAVLTMTGTFAPELEFRELFQSGYTGCEFDIADTSLVAAPVHDLIGLSDERRARSRALLEAATRDHVERLPGDTPSSKRKPADVLSEPPWRYSRLATLTAEKDALQESELANEAPVRILVESDINTEEEVAVSLAPLVYDPMVTLTSYDQESWTVEFRGKRWRLWPTGRRRWIELDETDVPIGVYYFGAPDAFHRKCILQLKRLPRNAGKIWEAHERRLLIQLISRGLPAASLASEFGRSVASVVRKSGDLQGIDLSNVLNLPDLEDFSIKELVEKSKEIRGR